MGVMVMIAQLILSLSILVVLHELGHFIPAKLFKTRVEKFYLFFDPWFSLVKKKIGDTEYGIGWLPLGGYVKIAGMIDESMDKEQMKLPPKPDEFRSKPAWQRLIIMLGGVTVNFILGFLIFGLIAWHWGEMYLSTENATNGIAVHEMGQKLGFEHGDKVLAIGDTELAELNDRVVFKEVILNNAKTADVLRNGSRTTIAFPDSAMVWLTDSENSQALLYEPRVPYQIYDVVPGSAAAKAGLKQGDRVVEVNGTPIQFFDEFSELVNLEPLKELALVVSRDGERVSVEATTDEQGYLGTYNYTFDHFYEVSTRKYTLLQALPYGVVKGYTFLADQFKAFGQMFKGNIKASDSLGGFVTITKLFPQQWHWQSFWTITAILSLILAIMNLLPIPALDGGHVMFLLWEVVTGRKPSDKFMEYATLIGFIIVLGLLLYANGLDVLRLLK